MGLFMHPALSARKSKRCLRFVPLIAWALVGLMLGGDALAQIPADTLLKSLRPTADVNDFAGILSDDQKRELETRCQSLRQGNRAQFAVVIVQSLEGGQIDDFANKLFAQWGVGEKGKDNGILLLVAMQDRKARVEVGYGLEPVLPDAFAGRVLNQQLFPAFKQQHYFEGLSGAVNRICEIVERGQPATAEERRPAGEMGFWEKVIMSGFLSVFVAIGSFVAGASVRSRVLPPILFGLFFGGIPFVLGFMMAAPVAPVIHIPIALLMVVLGWRTGMAASGREINRKSGTLSNNWTWFDTGSSGGWSTGSGGGFSSGGGGFGGGSSGGGGASGGW
jgi:uncharacterized protein